MALAYSVYDVFTDKKLAGNPLAVVFDDQGLEDEAMQSIAREMNLSETVFVQKAEHPTHSARLRIFTPGRELPFAGHPTVGTAIALAERRRPEIDIDLVSVLEENVGPVRCAVRLRKGEPSFAEFDLPRKSSEIKASLDGSAVAAALGLESKDIGFENHKPSLWSAGVAFVAVPVHDLAAAGRVEFDPTQWLRLAPFADGRLTAAYVYCRGGVHHQADFHARMFAPDMGISEDPATGAAVAALSGAIHQFDALTDGRHPLLIEQGVEMGRPSYIHLHLDVEAGAINAARIGGQAVRIASGQLEL